MTSFDETRYFSPLAPGASALPPKVSLVGAGPGDPDLLTVKALRLLQQAQLVVYDKLVSREVLALVPAQADRIYVGKQSGLHTLRQEEIIALLVRLARSGRSVVRLKGGDPYVFGRGGEEAQALAAAGIAFEVVPGITSAQGMAAATGIPLTHRDHATQVTLVTGHLRDEAGERGLELDWSCLARPHQTLVVYMGVATLPHVCAQLERHGLAADTPAAVVENATLPTQRTVTGTLRTLPTLARAHAIRAPALIVIGGVVALHAELAAQMLR
ncbi:MAG: uroporphyrinogen-III C-methyltransferase [Rhodoferax sp.]|jgi:uroporphyrin-III C-methyltransferase|nr:uroporphyrinogen-III C-methyltransferase [Rhodoferax sp.]MCP5263983.1 uroporphyrinogen-III C-methyltransferase [Rhodoferax sp.]MCW5627646.1 uroporphyrinogen-III C-methyltransferase [Rhodoferax sp.]